VTEWATLRQAAEHVKASKDVLAAAVRSGDLPAYPIGTGKREYRLDLAEVDAWMKARTWEPRSA
jgi:excisionase family DNA binding protein